jgi:hypothetical protein
VQVCLEAQANRVQLQKERLAKETNDPACNKRRRHGAKKRRLSK